jgi:hypothetical protein
MKWVRILVLVAALVLGFSTIVESAPFLVCDAYPSSGQQPTSFLVSFDGGAAIETGVQTNADGGVQLHYDLSALATGSHVVTVQAKNVWGVSASSVPLSFVKPATGLTVPTTPQLKAQ